MRAAVAASARSCSGDFGAPVEQPAMTIARAAGKPTRLSSIATSSRPKYGPIAYIRTSMRAVGSGAAQDASRVRSPEGHAIFHILQGFVTLWRQLSPDRDLSAGHGRYELARNGPVVVPIAVQFQIVHYAGDTRDALGDRCGLLEVARLPDVAGQAHHAGVCM